MEEFAHIAEAWKGSVLHQFSDVVLSSTGATSDWWLIGTSIGLFFLSLIFSNQIFSAIPVAFSVFFQGSTPKKCYENQYWVTIILLTTIIAFATIGLIIYILKISSLTFFQLPLCLIALLIVREIVITLFRWLRGNNEMWKMIQATIKVAFIVLAVMVLPVGIIYHFSDGNISDFVKYYAFVAFCVVYLIYLFRTSKIIFSSGCTIFFWFLYLCALEFIPIGIFISAFIRL